jgi:nicotinate-nucleotide--dimethylbenzimidazole phosphoribosyltransferase
MGAGITAEHVQARLDALAKPRGSLGRLEALAVELAIAQQSLNPRTHPRRIVLFAGDHGVVAQGVTPWPSAVTTAMAATILNGRASSTALARAHHADLRLVDAGMAQAPPGPHPSHYVVMPVARGTADLARGPAMSAAQFDTAWALGTAEAQRAAAEGFVLLVAGEMGIGNTTPAACIVHALAGIDADTATGSGAGADAAMRTVKRGVVADAVARLAGRRDKAAIAAIAGFEIAAMAGFYAQGARQGAVLLLDGYVATAAALLAEHLCPGTARAMIAAHLSAEPGHRAALAQLRLAPILEWQMRLGEGTGALIALPLLDSAAALLCDVALLADLAI